MARPGLAANLLRRGMESLNDLSEWTILRCYWVWGNADLAGGEHFSLHSEEQVMPPIMMTEVQCPNLRPYNPLQVLVIRYIIAILEGRG